MNGNTDLILIKERLDYEDSFLSVPEEDMFTQPKEPSGNESYNYIIGEEKQEKNKYSLFEIKCLMDVYCSTGYEDECWCDEYEPEFDPFDSLDEIPYDY